MKIAMFGASGRIGRRIAAATLERGHLLTAIARDPQRLDEQQHPQLRPVRGDALQLESFSAALAGQDAVVSALGPTGDDPTALSAGMHNIVAAMQTHGVRRIVVLGGAGILNLTETLLVRDAPGFPEFLRVLSGAHLEAWRLLEKSGLDWTILCPPATIEPGPRTGDYRVQTDRIIADPARPRGLRISFDDAAEWMIAEVEQGRYIGQRVNIAS